MGTFDQVWMPTCLLRSYFLVSLRSVAAMALFGLIAACASTDVDRRQSDIPWNQPQQWEGTPMVPGLDRY